jgi:hypothetical protein
MVFAHPDLVHLAKRPSHFYIDGTWNVAPPQFMQDFIVMLWDSAYEAYIPIFHCLLQRKTAGSYLMALNLVDQVCDFKLDPLTVTCDFEKALIGEIKAKFPRVEIVGCLFHLKQAWRKKLVSLGFDQPLVAKLMKAGQLDLLCYIDPNEIITKGIPNSPRHSLPPFHFGNSNPSKFIGQICFVLEILYSYMGWNVSTRGLECL